MSSILGLEKLKHLMDEAALEDIDQAAAVHSQSNIEFCILDVSENSIDVEATQLETRSKNYASEATLVKRTKEVFEKRLPSFTIAVRPVPFLPNPASVVNPKWLEKKMEEQGVRIKQIAFDTGVDRESIADWTSGKRSMSQIVKAMFYFYFRKS
ncbi:MAG: helix-turn-helix transcriptional regulator [Bacteroidota bacterium]